MGLPQNVLEILILDWYFLANSTKSLFLRKEEIMELTLSESFGNWHIRIFSFQADVDIQEFFFHFRKNIS